MEGADSEPTVRRRRNCVARKNATSHERGPLMWHPRSKGIGAWSTAWDLLSEAAKEDRGCQPIERSIAGHVESGERLWPKGFPSLIFPFLPSLRFPYCASAISNPVHGSAQTLLGGKYPSPQQLRELPIVRNYVVWIPISLKAHVSGIV